MPCDPLPPPADTPKPRPHYEEGKPLWFLIERNCLLSRPVLIRSEDSADDWDEAVGQGARWFGPYQYPWQPAALPEGHAELMREAAEAIEELALDAEFESAFERATKVAARLRAAAGGET
jgi:hypothetical protein